MARIDSNLILKPNVELKVEKIDYASDEVKALIEKTEKSQSQTLKLKKVDQKKLKQIVQL